MTEADQDSKWISASSWLRGEVPGGTLGKMAVLGIPAHLGSMKPGRWDLAPAAVRAALDRFSTFDIEDNVELLDLSIRDWGDVEIANSPPEAAVDPIRKAVSAAISSATAVVLLGGDNSITYPGVQAVPDAGLITFDAQFDLRGMEGGLHNGNPIRALLRQGLPGERIVQIGIQSFANSKAYLQAALDAGIRVFSADQVRERGMAAVVHDALQSFDEGCIYIDLDLGVLDSAYAPGAPEARPGGLTPSDLRTAVRLCGEYARVRVLDIVEMDPERDIANRTAQCGAACLLSFAAGVHRRCSRLRVAHNF